METSQLTFTRFVAAFFIVIYHFGGSLFPVSIEFIEELRRHLNLGVSYFFVLSGFVMMLAYGNMQSVNFLGYMKNRIARIYPLHLFTLFLTIAISIFVSINYLQYWEFNFNTFFVHVFLIQSWFPEYSLSLNVPSWSVSTELLFYLCFPLLLNYFINKVKMNSVIWIFLSFWLFSQIGMNWFYFSDYYGGYDSLDRYFLFYNPLLHLNSFCIGLMFGLIFINKKQYFNKNYDLAVIVTFAISAVLVYIFRDFMVHNGFFSIPFGILIYLIAANNGKLTKLFRNRWLIHLGEISFALYLLQNPVFIALRKVFEIFNLEAPYFLFFLGCIILLIASHFTYLYVEKPMRNKLRNLRLKI